MIQRHSVSFLSIGVAAALALGVSTPAAAQVPTDMAGTRSDTTPATSQQRIPDTKDQGALVTTTFGGALANPDDTTADADTTNVQTDTTQTDTTRADTTRADTTQADTTTMPSDTSSIRSDTTTAGAVTPTGQPAGDTVGIYPSSSQAGWMGGGFYIGVAGGASIPTGDLHDGGYDTGWNVTVPIGWQSSTDPSWGLRLDLSYDRLNGRTLVSVPGASVSLSDANIWSGALDLTLQFPIGSGRSAFYVMGGGGIHRFTDLSDVGTVVVGGNTLSGGSDGELTKGGVNGGLGLQFGFGRTELFLESRYVTVFTEGSNSNFIPIVLGFRLQ